VCGPEDINGYDEGVVDPEDECEGGRFFAMKQKSALIQQLRSYDQTFLCLRVIEYFRGRVSRPLYAVVAVVLLCGRLRPLDRVRCQSHAIWVRKAWFLLRSAAQGVRLEGKKELLRNETKRHTMTYKSN
jgi:hypothetical protein